MQKNDKRNITETENQYELASEKKHRQGYPIRVSGTGFELIEANGSIKILSNEQDVVNEILGIKEQNRPRKF